MPLGAMAVAEGVNFGFLWRRGSKVRLVLLPAEGPGSEAWQEIDLDPRKNRTGDHWHVLVSGLPPVFRYGWRVDGPAGDGHRFDPRILLLDPNSTALSDGTIWGCGPRPKAESRIEDRGSRVEDRQSRTDGRASLLDPLTSLPRAGARHSL